MNITAARHAPRRDVGLLWHQIRYEQLSFWRNPQSAFFTFVFPVVLITIFGALFHGGGGSSYFDGLSALQYYVPTIAALSVLAPATASWRSCCRCAARTASSNESGPPRCPHGPTSSGCWRTAS